MDSQLTSASAELLIGGRPHAGAALLRQIVKVEYLSWAFKTRDEDAAVWQRSDRRTREEFFRPVKLRNVAAANFGASITVSTVSLAAIPSLKARCC